MRGDSSLIQGTGTKKQGRQMPAAVAGLGNQLDLEVKEAKWLNLRDREVV